MAYDFKREQKELYNPGRKPSLIEVPPLPYAAVHGHGDPNAEDSEYKRTIEWLYAIQYTIKMSKMGGRAIDGYFDYVVPPLEDFWWQPSHDGIDYTRKDDFEFISAIRLPGFVTPEVFEWAREEASRKKDRDLCMVDYTIINEGLCVQCIHVGPYEEESRTIDAMRGYAAGQGHEPRLSESRLHHEIYLSDPRKTAPEKLKTVVRLPVEPATRTMVEEDQ
jgi:hypothetical protein